MRNEAVLTTLQRIAVAPFIYREESGDYSADIVPETLGLLYSASIPDGVTLTFLDRFTCRLVAAPWVIDQIVADKKAKG